MVHLNAMKKEEVLVAHMPQKKDTLILHVSDRQPVTGRLRPNSIIDNEKQRWTKRE